MNICFLRKTLNRLPHVENVSGRTFLFVTIRGFSFVLHQELFLANILARSGARVIIALDDGVLKHWDTYQTHQKVACLNPAKSIRNIVVRCFYLLLYAHKNISVIYLSKLTKKAKDKIVSTVIDEGDRMNAVSSTRRFFECGYYDENNEAHKHYYSLSIENIRIMKYASSELLRRFPIEAVITSHGIYSIWGSAYNFFRGREIKAFVYGAHAYRNSHIHFTDTLAQTLSLDSSCVEYMKQGALTDEIRKKVDDYFSARRNHSTKDTAIYYSWMNKQEKVSIGRRDKKTLNYGMFPNIIWDGDVAQRDTIFNGMLDWMIKTIDYFLAHPENNLIIRFHPAEATLWKDTAKLSETILSLYPKIEKTPNIILIKADQQIDTYAFVRENIDVGLIYDGMLSLELTHMRIPVISPSCNRFTGGSFVLRPNSRQQYFELLGSFPFEGYFTKAREEEFYKYAYWYLYLSAYMMPPYSERKFGEIQYSEKTLERIKCPEFMSLCRKFQSI